MPNMRTVTISFDANRLPLDTLTMVLGVVSTLRNETKDHEDMLMISESVQSVGGDAPQQTLAPESMKTIDHAQSDKRRVGRPKKGEVSQTTNSVEGLTEGPAKILDQIKAAQRALTRVEIAEMFPDTRGGTIGTWLHSLERRGLVISEPGAEGSTEYKAAMADA